ncbi:methionyl-tRNA formyltransferase [Candidatus Pelagibacter sp.]|nr:methionyl-tRNA formyltransferase [Candidatus Pelagibacter sp.]
MKKIVFMGTPLFAVPILKSIFQKGYEIPLVYTQPPSKSNRGYKLSKSPIQIFCEENNLSIRTPENFNKIEDEKKVLEKIEADMALVVAYGQILPESILNVCKKGFINIHASLLPKLRGAAPIQRSIMNLDNETGVSIMQINEKLDQGKVYSQHKIKINKDDNAEDLSLKLSNLAAKKIVDDIEGIFENKKKFFEQDHSKATYANKIKKEEGRIDWNDQAEKIIGKINGLYPVPGAWFYFDGARYKILKASVSKNSATPGTVIDDDIEVSCGTNSIKILEIQREGKKIQNIKDFILGTKIKKGVNLIDA